jgi:hypothetical protein
MEPAMVLGLVWIIAGLAIALANSVGSSSAAAALQDPAGIAWQLNVTGVVGLLLASQGCRMVQAGRITWRLR